MNAQTPLANILDKANDKSTYNEYAIKILSNPYILAYIMQGTVHECQGMTISEIVSTIDGKPEIRSIAIHPDEIMDEITGTKNEDIVSGEGRTFYDIRFHAYIPNHQTSIKILLNVEAQKKYLVTSKAIHDMIY